MDVVGPDVGVIFLFSVETVDFVVNNVEKCWDELWLVISLVLEMLKITRKSFSNVLQYDLPGYSMKIG